MKSTKRGFYIIAVKSSDDKETLGDYTLYVEKIVKPALVHPRLEIELIASAKNEFSIGGGWAYATITFSGILMMV